MHKILTKIHLLLLVGLAWSMSFSFEQLRLTSLFSLLIAANAVPIALLAKDRSGPRRTGIMLLLVSVYIMYVCGLLYSSNFSGAAFELEKKLTLLIFPLIFFYLPNLETRELRSVLLTFVGSCLLALVVCLSVAGYKWYHGSMVEVFFYHDLSQIVGMHAAYLAMYCCFSIAILLVLYPISRTRNSHTGNRLVFFVIALFVLGILLLAARMQLIILFLGLFIYTYILSAGKYGPTKSIISGLAVGIAAMGLMLLFPVNRERIKQLINYNNEYSINSKWGEQQMRPLVWSCALEVIKSAPLTGVGVGDGQEELQNCYVRNKYGSLTYFPDMRFNAHNQFLETAVQLGIVGLLVLVSSIAIPFFLAVRSKNILYILFIIIFTLSCLTESMLERQSGIVFFAFFNSILFLNKAGD